MQAQMPAERETRAANHHHHLHHAPQPRTYSRYRLSPPSACCALLPFHITCVYTLSLSLSLINPLHHPPSLPPPLSILSHTRSHLFVLSNSASQLELHAALRNPSATTATVSARRAFLAPDTWIFDPWILLRLPLDRRRQTPDSCTLARSPIR